MVGTSAFSVLMGKRRLREAMWTHQLHSSSVQRRPQRAAPAAGSELAPRSRAPPPRTRTGRAGSAPGRVWVCALAGYTLMYVWACGNVHLQRTEMYVRCLPLSCSTVFFETSVSVNLKLVLQSGLSDHQDAAAAFLHIRILELQTCSHT